MKETIQISKENIFPNKETFEASDFTFRQSEYHSDAYIATLPQDWHTMPSGLWNLLKDEKERLRGIYFYFHEDIPEPQNSITRLLTRFFISSENKHLSASVLTPFTTIKVKDRITKKVLFEAGQFVDLGLPISDDLIVAQNKAQDFLNKHYPDWQNPAAYWDLDENTMAYWQD